MAGAAYYLRTLKDNTRHETVFAVARVLVEAGDNLYREVGMTGADAKQRMQAQERPH
jgi:hypothetical protein